MYREHEHKEKYKKRSSIEWKNAELKRFLGLARAIGYGLKAVAMQAKLTVIAANLKRIAALVGERSSRFLFQICCKSYFMQFKPTCALEGVSLALFLGTLSVVSNCPLVLGGGNTGYYQKFSEVCKYVMNTKNHLECHWLYMNKKLFDSLSPDDQKIILDAAKQIEDAGFDWAKNNEQKYIDLMKQAGWTSYEYTDEEIAAFAENVRTEIWPQLEPLYDPEVWAELVSHFK